MIPLLLTVVLAASAPEANSAPQERNNHPATPAAAPERPQPAEVEPQPSIEEIDLHDDHHGASGSMMVRARKKQLIDAQGRPAPDHALRQRSMFAIAPPEPRLFKVHDLVQIIIRETSRATSSQELEAKKDYKINAAVNDFPELTLTDLLKLHIAAGTTTPDPKLNITGNKDFKGEGDYERTDDLTARLSAEVIDVLPNGNLILEAKTFIKTDTEQATIKVTGICRPQDVTAANTVQSQQIHDLKIQKMHEGELKQSSKKGLFSKILDTIFAF